MPFQPSAKNESCLGDTTRYCHGCFLYSSSLSREHVRQVDRTQQKALRSFGEAWLLNTTKGIKRIEMFFCMAGIPQGNMGQGKEDFMT